MPGRISQITQCTFFRFNVCASKMAIMGLSPFTARAMYFLLGEVAKAVISVHRVRKRRSQTTNLPTSVVGDSIHSVVMNLCELVSCTVVTVTDVSLIAPSRAYHVENYNLLTCCVHNNMFQEIV